MWHLDAAISSGVDRYSLAHNTPLSLQHKAIKNLLTALRQIFSELFPVGRTRRCGGIPSNRCTFQFGPHGVGKLYQTLHHRIIILYIENVEFHCKNFSI